MAQAITIHFVDSDIRARAEAARQTLALGHHAEVYAELEELGRHAPRDGIVVAQADALTGDVGEMLSALCGMGIALPLVVASKSASVGRVVDAVRAGALDYLPLPIEQAQLAAMIKRAGCRAPAEAETRQLMIAARERLARLSDREREVLALLVEGGSNKGIARRLDISPRTVEIHRAHIMLKLDAKHVVEAVRLYYDARF